MRVLYGTTNQAKLNSMRKITEGLGIEMVGLKELGLPLPQVEENGNNPLENARIKAESYYRAFGMPVFSCDSGLYFEGLEEALQPGVHTRRVNGKELNDEEMIEYYSELAKTHNNQLIGRYRNAICFIIDDSHVFTSMDESLATERFLLVRSPHERRTPGFPLDSLSVDIKTGKYYYDIENRTVETKMEEGFYHFFEDALREA